MTSKDEFELPDDKQLIIVISGLSGAGKDSVVEAMVRKGLLFRFVVTATSREKREDEVDGRDYYFISKEEFERMIEADELLEHATVYGEYKGVPRKELERALASGEDVVLRLDVQGAATVKQEMRNALLIFITVESEEDLRQRLRKRHTETAEELEKRIAKAREEVKCIDTFDYVVVNREDELDQSVDIIQAIIKAEHHRVQPGKAAS
ncbi:MAG TPA: guanylate kinase [Anaerolineales bacterium]